MAKKQSSKRSKRDVIRVEGQKPNIRPKAERISIMARIERYLLADVLLKRTMHCGFLTKAEYRKLAAEYADQRGLPGNSIFRDFFEW
ncbi:MAG: hypothetical protein Q4E13_03090 [Clostridia bacterium]|nr:hypothetical protein [Clostridia bacterium]